MAKNQHKILIVDDEEDLCEILQFNLEGEGFSTKVAHSAEEALQYNLKSFDLLLLDIMMDKMSGFKLAEKIRKDQKLQTPIIFITARNDENDLLTGFNLGGDDYITKPFSVKEVIVRVKAILKRSPKEIKSYQEHIVFGEMEMNFSKKSMQINKKKVKLTKKEFEILALLLKHQGHVLSRNEIIDKVWDDATIITPRTVDVHMTRLRKKIEKYGKHIKSMAGYGYTFEA